MANSGSDPGNILGTLGLAMKAGRLVSGEFMTERAIRDGEAKLVVVAGDASPGTKKKFTDSCTYYQVPIIITADKETLGRSLGKEYRASLAVIDEGFATSIRNKFTGEVLPYGKNESV
ncbi:MAG: ribosomal L7Ae/L30e/S12e/Gadd45 family protein [Eubacterium sp.]|nr:ribosomal L7Ae/L30e/S12e/Gadd45 family protein [Eubacterium sp.]